VQLTAWRRELAFGRRELQEEIGRLESAASIVRLFGFDVIPGLAQTAAYAEAMFVLGRVELPDEDDLAAVVEARMAQRAVLEDPAKRIRLLCTETAFWRSLLEREAMLEQIDRVLEVAALPNVEFGVIPFSAREPTQTYHAFAVLGDPGVDEAALVLAETVTGGLVIRGDMDIRLYIEHFHQLWRSATLDLRELLREVAAKAPWR
jgi:hypothetical protein